LLTASRLLTDELEKKNGRKSGENKKNNDKYH
jgi:hypothetical protein